MGKKGKKKETGTPDVQKFKKTREYWMLKEIPVLQESMPFVATDFLDDPSYVKLARCLNMVGLLAEFLQVNASKDYRFNYHHKYLAPIPQFFPFGYPIEVIRQARLVQEKPGIMYNGKEYQFSESLRTLSDKFLKDVDGYNNTIGMEIDPRVKDDFANGLKRFKVDLKDVLERFDAIWVKYEQEYVKAHHRILEQVFEQVDRLCTLELMLTQAEERLDIEAKQALEEEFVHEVEQFARGHISDLPQEYFPENVIPLAEACIFYETKVSEEDLHVAKYLIKDYLELRIFISKIPEDRMRPVFKENKHLMRLIKSFHESVLTARGALDIVSRLPPLIHAKTSTWMTKQLLEPDLRYIQKMALMALEA